MSGWEKYRNSRTSWGINVLGSIFVEIEATDGTVGFATGFGGMNALSFTIVRCHSDIALLCDDLPQLKLGQ